MLNCLKKSILFVWHSTTRPSSALKLRPETCIPDTWRRRESNYNAYPTFDTPSPYKSRKGIRRFYEYKSYLGGILPRPEGKWEDIPLPMPTWSHANTDNWTKKKALFGQNDYIDILGDGTVHPWQLLRAPVWLKGYGGNELQRTARQLKMQGTFIREMFPTKYHKLTKNLNYQFKKINRRQHCSWWGGYKRFSRIDKPRLRY